MSAPWWENKRGELFVLGQCMLFGLIAFGPRTLPLLPQWSATWRTIGEAGGMLFMVAGGMVALAGTLKLGRNLTPFITPVSGAVLLEQGAYRLVRHPIYSGILQMACGWGLWNGGWLTLVYTAALFLLFDRKARREEQILLATFPDYGAYSRRVKRLLPFIY